MLPCPAAPSPAKAAHAVKLGPQLVVGEGHGESDSVWYCEEEHSLSYQ